MQGIISSNDLLAVIIKHLAFPGQAKLFLAAFDEQGFKNTLKRANLLANSGLGDTVDLSCFGETLSLRQIAKHLHAFYLHKKNQYQKLKCKSTNDSKSPAKIASLRDQRLFHFEKEFTARERLLKVDSVFEAVLWPCVAAGANNPRSR